MSISAKHNKAKLSRTTLATSREMDFCSETELTAQTGHAPKDWPLVVLKELADNALDACEEAGVAPEIDVKVERDRIIVTDNGPGIPASTVEKVLDFLVRVSSREAYVAPDRGAQGNALKTILAIPVVLDGKAGRVEITTRGVHHTIDMTIDSIRRRLIPAHRQGKVEKYKTGSCVSIAWPDSASSILTGAEERFVLFAEDYTFLNPHLTLTLNWMGDVHRIDAIERNWLKWRSSDPTSVWWYSVENLTRLIGAYVAHDQDNGSDRTVWDFLGEFRGLSRSDKRKNVLDATGLSRMNLSALVDGHDIRQDQVESLLSAMRRNSRLVKPAALGILGRENLEAKFQGIGCDMASFEYRKEAAIGEDGLPFVLETAFAQQEDYRRLRRVVAGVNWSPGILNPFRQLGVAGGLSLDSLLEAQRVGDCSPVVFLVHYAGPRPKYTDRGKSAVVVTAGNGQAVANAVTAVTRKWCRDRKADERHRGQPRDHRDATGQSRRITVKEAAWEVMEQAYLKASSNGQYPAHARQIMYAARPLILDRTHRHMLDDAYFTQQLLPDFMQAHPDLTTDWDVVFDARGHLREPHTDREIALGTVEVRDYLDGIDQHEVQEISAGVGGQSFPTMGPAHRYGAILFIEKEGFMPLLRKARLAERYDIAIMSTKGLSTTAARRLVDTLCHDGVPLLVLHDFDKAGFSIVGTLQRNTRRYEFENTVNVVDLGLRLADVRTYRLQTESCRLTPATPGGADPAVNLKDNGATDEEIEFLCGGQRVELNAFTSGDLLEWIETKLREHGITKVVPDSQTLDMACRRALLVNRLSEQLGPLVKATKREVDAVKLDHRWVERNVRKRLKENPDVPWDQAVTEVALTKLGGLEPGQRKRRAK